MKPFAFVATAFLSCCLMPATGTSLLAAAAATKGLFIGGLTGAALTSGGGETVVIQTKPGHVMQTVPAHQQVVVEHKPVALVPLATIPSYSFTDRLARLWGGISDSVGGKIRAVGDFFRPAPRVVLVNVETTTTTTTTTTTPKPTTTKKPCPQNVVLEVVAGVPKYRFVSFEDCEKN